MNWLKRLKNQSGPDADPAKPDLEGFGGFGGFGVPVSGAFVEKKVEREGFGGFVASVPGAPVEKKVDPEGFGGFVASVPGHIENSMMAALVIVPVPDWATGPANDSTVAAVGAVARVATVAVANPPGSEAAPAGATDAEIDRFNGRLALFTAKGLTSTEAGALANKLLIRDCDGDDRRVCLECSHLSGWAGRRQCRGLHHAGMGGPLVLAGQVVMLQRCDGFKAAR